ncbi:ROK family protein [Bacillus sp. HMF5848]|uniref:ROK family protein n=1 Tax=Bacillus sp. HMF5848 TaxID=2495421 RepID=UPI000F797F36|nr:ROK family protein [Bacillus sp. HMF5848]RSK28875.1 ROK family protein [Bacillus sp. HMF5848]
MKAIGIDIGGTAIKGAIIDTNGTFLVKEKINTDITIGREGILQALFTIIDRLLAHAAALPSDATAQHEVTDTAQHEATDTAQHEASDTTQHEASDTAQLAGIGIGSAGRINPITGEVVYATANLPGWQGTNIKTIIEEKYGLPCHVDNDANVALLGELWLGPQHHFKNAIMLTLGTGVGGANIINGQLVTGAHCQSGEWGHVVLVPNGHPCNCGKKGCIEQYLSGTALVRQANEAVNQANALVRQANEAVGPTSTQYTHGQQVFVDSAMHEVVDTYLDYLALVIYNMTVAIDPDAIIIGGGVIDSKHIWWPQLITKLATYEVATPIIPAALGNQAGVAGASKLVFDAHTQNA